MDRSKLFPGTPETRKAMKAYWKAVSAGESPSYPEWMSYVTCGAKTRAGTPCMRRDLYGNGRCALHGGLSTGPKTKKGRKQSAINGRKNKAAVNTWEA